MQCKSFQAPWRLSEREWQFGRSVLLCYAGEAHATDVMWDRSDQFIGWYVNLQEPLRRIPQGFETLDHELDLVVQPDGVWRWKDVEYLAEAEALGVFSAAQCAAVRAEGERVVIRIEAWAAPFDGSWLDWRAPPDWQPPTLPLGWEVVR
jgi:predicted RNA-binding protein associated with RNAse of E/G family